MTQSILVWLLFEHGGEVLLARPPAGPFAGQWVLPGDVVTEDESAEEALRRFAREELAVEVTGEEFEETLYLSAGDANFVTNVFRVAAYEGEPRFRKRPSPGSLPSFEEMRWVHHSELAGGATLPVPPGLRRLLAGDGHSAGVPDNKAAWDLIGAAYQAQRRLKTDAAHYGPRMPTENDLRLLGDVRGKRVLEIGCGGGQGLIAFAKQGAIATGIDQSVVQLRHARGLAAQEGVSVDFLEADITTLPQIKSASQDAVFSAYALGYVEDIGTCFAEVVRVLCRGGVFVFSVDHPVAAMMWGGEDRLRVQRGYWDVYREWEWGDGSGIWMRSWIRPVSEWFALLRDAGFIVDRILEPKMLAEAHDETWDDAYPFEQGIVIPTTLIFRAVKP